MLCLNMVLLVFLQRLNRTQEQDIIDKQVVHGHVVPNVALFTRTVQDETTTFESLAFTDNLKVLISMANITSEGEDGVICEYCRLIMFMVLTGFADSGSVLISVEQY